MVIGAVAQNTEAIRLYERRGFRVTWTVLTRFAPKASGLRRGPDGPDPFSGGIASKQLPYSIRGLLPPSSRPMATRRHEAF